MNAPRIAPALILCLLSAPALSAPVDDEPAPYLLPAPESRSTAQRTWGIVLTSVGGGFMMTPLLALSMPHSSSEDALTPKVLVIAGAGAAMLATGLYLLVDYGNDSTEPVEVGGIQLRADGFAF